MIICSSCGKENQEHYKFCLGCGAEIVGADPDPAERNTAPVPALRHDEPRGLHVLWQLWNAAGGIRWGPSASQRHPRRPDSHANVVDSS
ncbi:MAG: zinc ribbon domain-containing protein [Deltaproteobacteria bacterium]|nr:zinc ribbon domain-containing protein [Deltaproteobacteria bacterium]